MGINRNVLYADGAQHVAEHGGAYWLLNEIAIIQPYNKAVAAEEFQVWKLAVHPDRTATLTCDDDNGNIVFYKEIEHTDFPHPMGPREQDRRARWTKRYEKTATYKHGRP